MATPSFNNSIVVDGCQPCAGGVSRPQNRISPLSKPWLSEYDADPGNAGGILQAEFVRAIG